MAATAPFARHILVVDDDANIRSILHRFLVHPSWTVDDAENGPQALSKFTEGSYDTVLLDIEMPEMDGFEVMRRIRAFEAQAGGRRHAAIIAFSSHDDDDTKARARAAGCDGYVAKPATHQVIIDAVVGAGTPAAVAHDPDIAALLPAFLEAKEREIRELDEAIAHGHSEPARAISHRLRGSFSLYGFTEAAAVCAEIESLAAANAANSLAIARERLPMLYALFTRMQAGSRDSSQAQ